MGSRAVQARGCRASASTMLVPWIILNRSCPFICCRSGAWFLAGFCGPLRWRRHRIWSRLPHARALVRRLWQKEQDLFHRVVLPSSCYRGGRTLQHSLSPVVGRVFVLLSVIVSGLRRAFWLLGAASKVLCVHSLLEHTDVTIMYDNEALYDICRRQVVLKHTQRLFFLIP